MSKLEFSRYCVMALMRSDLCLETYLSPLSHRQSVAALCVGIDLPAVKSEYVKMCLRRGHVSWG
jgi:hypothetical protein